MDECLPYQVALTLKQVGYNMTCWWEEFNQQQGLKDPYIIPYLGAKQYTWVTKDDKAKKEHKADILAAQISVVWFSGLDRPGLRKTSLEEFFQYAQPPTSPTSPGPLS